MSKAGRRLLTSGAVTLALAASGCDTTDTLLDQFEVEDGIAAKLAKTDGKRPKSVTCPEDVKQEKGETFDCDIKYRDGTKATAKVELTNDDGAYTFSVER